MKKVKCELEKKMEKLGKEARKNKTAEKKEKGNGKIYVDGKICPFMTSPDEQVACTSQCKIYRSNKDGNGFECPFSELSSISWKLKGKGKEEEK